MIHCKRDLTGTVIVENLFCSLVVFECPPPPTHTHLTIPFPSNSQPQNKVPCNINTMKKNVNATKRKNNLQNNVNTSLILNKLTACKTSEE